MKRNVKGEIGAIATVSVLSAFLLLKHSNLSSFVPFKIPFISHSETDAETEKEYVPIGKMVLDGEYELGQDWMLHLDRSGSSADAFEISKKGVQTYCEDLMAHDRCNPVLLSGSGLNGYVRDLTGSGESDFVLEQETADTTSPTGQKYTYTIYTLGDKGVLRHRPQQTEAPVVFQDMDKDGSQEEIAQDTAFIDFENDKRLGSKEQVLLKWGGHEWEFAQGLMKQRDLNPAALNKLVGDIDAKIIRYDTPSADGKSQEKRIEIHPNAWQSIVHLIYHGDSRQAKQILERVWKDNETAILDDGSNKPITREQFWTHIWDRVNESPYRDAIRSMNNVTD